MNDLGSFYLKRKQHLDKLKPKNDSAASLERTIKILSNEAVEMLKEEIESPYRKINKSDSDCNSSFEERFYKYLKELENEQKKKT